MATSSANGDRSLTIISQQFHPEFGGSAARITELAVGLQNRDWDVTVVTGQPSYSEFDRDRDRLPRKGDHEGVTVRRLPTPRFDRNAGLQYRLLNNLSFLITALGYLLFRSQRDPVLLTTIPPFLPASGAFLPTLTGSPFAVLCHDLYPETAVRLGYLSTSGMLTRVWSWLNRRSFSRASVVIVLGENMRETIHGAYGDDCEVAVVHNWEDGRSVRPLAKAENSFAVEHGLVNKLTVMYSGNHGQLHDLESVVKAATLLEKRHDNISQRLRFVFIGGGPKKRRLQRLANERRLDTVKFLPYQPPDMLSESLTCGDAALVTMADVADGVCVPGKFYTALASGQAILAVASRDTDVGRVVESNGCGIRVDPCSPEDIADAVEYWLDKPGVADEMGANARELFESKFSKERALDAFNQELSQLAEW